MNLPTCQYLTIVWICVLESYFPMTKFWISPACYVLVLVCMIVETWSTFSCTCSTSYMLSLSSTGEHTMCGCYRPHICCLDTDFVYVIIYHVSNVSRDAVVSVPSLALSGYCLCYSTTLHQRGGFSLERGRRIFLLPLTINTVLPASKQCSTIAEHIHSAYRTNPMLGSGPFEVEQQQSNQIGRASCRERV